MKKQFRKAVALLLAILMLLSLVITVVHADSEENLNNEQNTEINNQQENNQQENNQNNQQENQENNQQENNQQENNQQENNQQENNQQENQENNQNNQQEDNQNNQQEDNQNNQQESSQQEHTPETTQLSDVTVYIKYGSSGNLNTLVSEYVKSKIGLNNNSIESENINGTVVANSNESGSIKLTFILKNGDTNWLNVNYQVISPDRYELKTKLSDLSADSKNYESEYTFLNYINSDLTLRVYGDDYDNAIGSGKEYKLPNFTWSDTSEKYNAFGGVTYTFSKTFENTTITRSVKVSTISNRSPSVSIDYESCTIDGTNADMQYSFDKKSWNACTENMTISSNFYNKTVYFRYKATSHTAESDSVSLEIPNKAEKPKVSLKLVSTTHSVVITNCWDFDDVEYSIDGKDYRTTTKDTYTFNGLEADTQYTVYVRKRAKRGSLLASDAVTSSIKTNSKLTDEVVIDYSYEGTEAKVKGIGSVENKVSSNSISGDYTTTTLTRFKSIVDGYVDKKLHTVSDLTINQFIDKNETNTINSINFSLPMQTISTAIKNGNLSIEYNNDFVKIEMDNASLKDLNGNSGSGTLNIVTSKPTSVSNSWLKSRISSGRPVYEFKVYNGSNKANVSYILKYELKTNEKAPNIEVYNVESNGDKKKVSSTYNEYSGELKITTNLNGYFVIENTGSAVMKFKDVPSNMWYNQYVTYCYNNGIFNGTSENEFSPNTDINRAMIYTLIARMSREKLVELKDTDESSALHRNKWFFPYLYWAKSKNLINGYDIKPEEPMTRADITEVLYKFMQYKGFNEKQTVKYDEIYTDMEKESAGAKNAVAYLYQYGIMNGVGDKQFNPKANLSRAEMSAILTRLDKIITK